MTNVWHLVRALCAGHHWATEINVLRAFTRLLLPFISNSTLDGMYSNVEWITRVAIGIAIGIVIEKYTHLFHAFVELETLLNCRRRFRGGRSKFRARRTFWHACLGQAPVLLAKTRASRAILDASRWTRLKQGKWLGILHRMIALCMYV